ncbi:MAG: dienelactone hydrolase family protein [Pseudomonadota bacterium]
MRLNGVASLCKLAYVVLLLIFVPCSVHADSNAPGTAFTQSELKTDKGTSFPIFRPTKIDESSALPLVLFLHGAGERGLNNEHLAVGLPKTLIDRDAQLDAIVIAPQVRSELWWSDRAMEEFALAALDKTLESFAVDRDRIYLTGMSMGGHGAWFLAAKHPGVFAAVVPVCARIGRPQGLPPLAGSFLDEHKNALAAAIAERIETKPIWIFHGGQDPVVPVSESRKMVEALNARGASALYTEYPNTAHEAWVPAYGDQKLFDWILQQRLAKEQIAITP